MTTPDEQFDQSAAMVDDDALTAAFEWFKRVAGVDDAYPPAGG